MEELFGCQVTKNEEPCGVETDTWLSLVCSNCGCGEGEMLPTCAACCTTILANTKRWTCKDCGDRRVVVDRITNNPDVPGAATLARNAASLAAVLG